MAKRFDESKALRNKEKFYVPLQRVVRSIFAQIIYKPIFDIVDDEIGKGWLEQQVPVVAKERAEQIKDEYREEAKRNKEVLPQPLRTLHNAKSDLIKAILSGRVQYENNHFEGVFSAKISGEIRKVGGRWDKRRKHWYILLHQLPYDVQLAVGQARDRMSEIKRRIDNHLAELGRINEQKPRYGLDAIIEKIVQGLETDFARSMEDFVLAPELTPEMAEALAREYTDDLSTYISGWTEESVRRLREKVQQNAFNGFRSSELAKMLMKDYQISKNKADFLARQETSLLMSHFREERYKSVGVQKYRWSTAGDNRVRPEHKALNGRIFTWDNPPLETGEKHPGEDFGCRCIAIPIID